MTRFPPMRLLAALMLALTLQGCGGDGSPTASDALPHVGVIQAREQVLDEVLRVTGSLEPRRVVRVYAQTPGLVVTQWLAEEGTRVRAGQVLARLSPEHLQAGLAAARSELQRSAQALRRAEALQTDGAVASSEAEAATAAHAQARAKVRSLEIDHARTELRAQVAGVLLSRKVEVGDIANDQVLFEIAADGATELVADASESVWHRIRVGQPAELTLPDGRVVPGHVRRLSGALDARTRLGRVWIAPEAPAAGAVSGGGAGARIHVARNSVLAIPLSSLLFDSQGAYVYVVVDGKAQRRSLALGTQDGAHAEVRQGLSPGEAVVARAGALLREGDPVVAVQVARGREEA